MLTSSVKQDFKVFETRAHQRLHWASHSKGRRAKVQDCSIKLAVADEQHIENDGR